MTKSKKFIKKLQSADEATKNRWIWFVTLSFGLIIVLLWTGYLNWSLENVSYEGVVLAQKNQASFIATFLAGVASLKHQAQDGVDVLLRENLLSIDMPPRDFVYDGLEKITLTNLP